MTIPAAAKPTPIPKIDVSTPLVDTGSGAPSMQGLQRLERLRGYVTGMGRIIPCSCVGTNELVLTPNGHGDEDGESPILEGLKFGDVFLFWAENNSTGAVTASVVPKTGTLASLPVFIDNGATQAGNGDIVADDLLLAFYAPHLGVSGGFVLK